MTSPAYDRQLCEGESPSSRGTVPRTQRFKPKVLFVKGITLLLNINRLQAVPLQPKCYCRALSPIRGASDHIVWQHKIWRATTDTHIIQPHCNMDNKSIQCLMSHIMLLRTMTFWRYYTYYTW